MSTSRVIGRPRSETSRRAILEAAFALLVARGYAGFAIESVAAAAGVGKTTVYRWWESKAALAVDAFFHATEAELRFPDTGLAESDFRAQIAELAGLLRGGRGQALAAMLGGARTDPLLARALGERWLEPR
ncbi:MAG: TetR family transcriptional regulator, partial [Sphingomonas sp.]|nr:TetR family transcriptional regulator [Sphingomonas sp.]